MQAMKAYRRNSDIAPLIRNFATRSRLSHQLHAPAALPPVPIEYEGRWILEPIWTLWNTQKSRAPVRNDAPAHSAHSPVTDRVHYCGSGNLRKVEVKMSPCLITHNIIKKCGGVEVQLHALFTLALDWG